MARTQWAPLLMFMSLHVGCGTSNSQQVSTLSPNEQITKFCADTIGPLCRALFSCCSDPQTLNSLGPDEAGCESTQLGECQRDLREYVLPHIEADETALDASKLVACVAKLMTMQAGADRCDAPPESVLLRDCYGAFVGKLPDGVACPGEIPDRDFIPCEQGVCVQGHCKAFLPLGAACENPNLRAGGCDYVHWQYCSPAGHCARVGQVGEMACAHGTSQGFSCASGTCDATGRCVAPTPETLCKRL